MKYEYKILTIGTAGFIGGKVDAIKVQEQFTELGNDGWELVNSQRIDDGNGSTYSIVYVFKKELK